MTTENTVSFKVFLAKEDSPDQPEVRRFGIDRDVVSNYSYMKEKLQMVFPSLNGKNFTVHWKDSDGDNIIITSDEELMIGLTEMQTDVRKLFVMVKPSLEHNHPQDGSSYPVHIGVTCDGCGKSVQGFRYKCVQCPDFDLCSTCENANLHGEHFMIRVPTPINWRPHFGRRLAHHLSKSARKGGLTSENMCGENQVGHACPAAAAAGGVFCPYPPRGHHGRNRGHGGHHRGLGSHNWLETLSNYLSEWSDLPGEAEPPNAAANSTNVTANSTTDSTQPEQEQPQQEQQHIKFLKTVGQTVAQLLDPFGIDVDVEVRTKNDTGEKVISSETTNNKNGKEGIPASKNVTFADNIHETVVKEVASRVNDMTIGDKANESNGGAIPKATASSRNLQTSPEAEGWTVVNGMETDQVPSASPPVLAPTPTPTPTPAPATPVSAENFYEAARRAAMFGAQQAMAAQQVMLGANQNIHEAAHHAAHKQAMADAQQAQHAVADIQQKVQQAQQAVAHAQQQAQWPVWGAPHPMQHMAASGNNNIYPNLVQQLPHLNSVAPEQLPHHPQPHINEAVQQMMSMGFQNEGGWLTQLLETQNGDIAKVFDILQPVKK